MPNPFITYCEHDSLVATCGACSPLVRTANKGVQRRRDYAGGLTKQDMIDKITKRLGIARYTVSNGSSEPTEFVNAVLAHFGIAAPQGASRPDKVGMVVRLADLAWDDSCHSQDTRSGGGSTTTAVGLSRFGQAVEILAAI